MEKCSKDHGSMYIPQQGEYEPTDKLATLRLCYYNELTEWITSKVRNGVTLIVCLNHRDNYDFNKGIPLSKEAGEAYVQDIHKKHRETQT